MVCSNEFLLCFIEPSFVDPEWENEIVLDYNGTKEIFVDLNVVDNDGDLMSCVCEEEG